MNKLMHEFSGFTFASLFLLSGLSFTPLLAHAEDESVMDEVNVTIPISCSMSGVGMNTHNATIKGKEINSAIGETTAQVFCNDNNGFAIYAVGFTDDTLGKNVLSGANLDSTHDIVTGTATSGNVSNWAMKLSTITDPAPTYPLTIQNSFDSFHDVPSSYTMVAKRMASTDVGQSAIGSSFKTTYQAYISGLQSADTYTGQVKYTLVHPSTAPEPLGDNQVAVIYDGNGLFFDQAGTRSTNKVVYENICEDEYGYIGDTPTILKTRNLGADGTQNGPYSYEGGPYYEGDGLDPDYAYFEGASKLKIVIAYGLSQYVGYISPSADGHSIEGAECGDLCDSDIDRSGTVTLVKEGSSFSIYSELGSSATNPGYDYGIYAEVYPIYDEPTAGTTYGLVRENVCSFRPAIGTFANVIGGNDMWYNTELSEDVETFYADGEYYYDEDIIGYLNEHVGTLSGTTITLHASNTYTIVFDANGGSGTMASQKVYQYDSTKINESTFTMPHKEVIRWTTNPDGSGDTIYANPDSNGGDYLREPLASAGETIRLYAQWGDCIRGKICYDDNGANSNTKMGKQSLYSSIFDLWASNFKRQNYGFAGWNTKADYTGKNYGPNENIELNTEGIDSGNFYGNEGLRIFAQWILSAGNLQNWSGCSSMGIGNVTALTDTRDSNTYAVAKLADGNCWMIENLRLGGTSPITLTTSDTQSAGTLPASTGTSWTSYTGQYLNSRNIDSTIEVMQRGSSNVYSYGNYYSWAAAINSAASYSSNVDVTSTSICPVGWHLPYYGDQNGGYKALGDLVGANSNNSNVLRAYPINLVLSGYLGSRYSTSGYYWVTRSANNGRAYYVSISSTSYNTGSTDYFSNSTKTNGYAVRCVMNSPN